jgi:hypothetical protein
VAARFEPNNEGKWVAYDRIETIRAMRGHETVPPPDSVGSPRGFPLGVHVAGDDVWSVLIRWTDTAGQRWEFTAPQDREGLAQAPRRLRRHSYQRWLPKADDW